jgi:hypothetical protein
VSCRRAAPVEEVVLLPRIDLYVEEGVPIVVIVDVLVAALAY